MSLAVVSSYFSASDLGVVDADPGQEIQFDLTQFFSNKTDIAQNHNDANLSVTFYPDDANSYLSFDPASARLDGQVPGDSQLAKIVVTFIAYSQVTHSTSHATLSVVSPQLEAQRQGLDTSARITAIVFGIIGGLTCLGVAVALYRRHTRVRNSAVLAEEGALARSDEEKKKYHGIATNLSKALREDSKNDNWSRKANTSISVEKCSFRKPPGTNKNLPSNEHEDPGPGLPRAVKKTSSTTHVDTHSVRSGEFLGRVKETVRIVSKKSKRNVTPARPIIGSPKPLTPRHGVDELPIGSHYVDITTIPSQYTLDNPFSDTEINVKRASTVASLVGSPSDSADEKSIPRRRADFGPPRSLRSPRELAPAAVKDTARRRYVFIFFMMD
jgi:axial budding pattern protein 2